MIAVVYASSAVELFTTAPLIALLDGCRRNNTRNGITGLLRYRGGNFMQVLEGDDEEPIAVRAFADWSMAFGNLDDPEVAGHPGVSDFLDRPLTDPSFTTSPHRCLTLLRTFRQAMR